MSIPSLDILVGIARVLEVSLDYLLTGKSYGADKVKNPLLIEKIEEVDDLPGEYQKTLISVLVMGVYTLLIRRSPNKKKAEHQLRLFLLYFQTNSI